MSIDRADLAYAAALIDTLAVLKTREVNGTDLPVLAVNSSRHTGAIKFLCKLTGVKMVLTSRSYSRHQCTEHCPSSHLDIESRGERWMVVGAKATIVAHNVLPYLRVQREAARELVAAGRTVGYKGQVVAQMKQLGWEIPELKPQPRARVRVP